MWKMEHKLHFNITADGHIKPPREVKSKEGEEFTATNLKVNKEEDPKKTSSCILPGFYNVN